MRHRVCLLTLILLPACDSKPEAAEPESRQSATKTASSVQKASSPARAAHSARPAPSTVPTPENLASPPKDAETTDSGLATKVLEEGNGKDTPDKRDRVRVHYTGWTKDGEMFDSSVTKGVPAVFGVGQVIPGWTEGLQLMVEGEKRRLWIPSKLAYGDKPKRPGAPSGDLVFDVELIEIIEAPEPPPVPDDLEKPPPSAKETKSGLSYRVLKEGKGKSPSEKDFVRVHYTGWTKDGEMFDSSVTRGQPAVFRLDQVIPGWTEGVQLMQVGEKTRFWIPAKLAYGEKPKRPGAPSGDLVFDVELVQVLPRPGR